MENNKAFTLENGGKAFFFHRRFLPIDQQYKKNRKNFFVRRVKRDVSPVSSPLFLFFFCQHKHSLSFSSLILFSSTPQKTKVTLLLFSSSFFLFFIFSL